MTEASPSIGPQQGMVHLRIWHHASRLQAMRVLMEGTDFFDSPASKQADCYMFAIAVRNALRGVDLVRKVSPNATQCRIDLAMSTFNKQVPQLTDLRNVLDHFDEYAIGKGRLQDPDGWLPNAWYEQTENSYIYNVSISRQTPLLRMDVRATQEALLQLGSDVEEAISNVP